MNEDIVHPPNKNVPTIFVGTLTLCSQWTLGSKGSKQRYIIDFGERQWVWMICVLERATCEFTKWRDFWNF